MLNKNTKFFFYAKDIFTGTVLVLPILFVYFAIGITFGVVASETGISPLNTLLMSLFVYAGAAQLVAVQLIGVEASSFSIIFTILVINSRFFVMSSSISSYFHNFSFWQKLLYGIEITDATYAIHANRFKKYPIRKLEIFTTNVVGHIVWVLSTLVGIYLGNISIDLKEYGADFAMTAMFIGLMVPLIVSRVYLLIGIVSAISTITFYYIGFSYWTTLAATFIAVAIGIGFSKWIK
tara:strand:+ start:679 stop:1386 length:708 start_codon:yes stop_codon:yes gene_type:complete